MLNAKVIIGANFGDEGKGLMTDYFCRVLQSNAGVLNVRFNGGAQAGHTVTTKDGLNLIFSHFGSGSLNKGVNTYLSKHFIVNPILFQQEYSLKKKILEDKEIYVHPECYITLPCDMMINQLLENTRHHRHGSCGVGIFETVRRNTIPKFTITALDLTDPDNFLKKVLEVYSLYVPHRLKELSLRLTDAEESLLYNINIVNTFIYNDCSFFKGRVILRDDSILGFYDNVVFEGAQGLLLDKDNMEYFPHLTPSNTGITNINDSLELFPDSNLEVIYVTRSYLTRHGAGRFSSEAPKDCIVGPDFIDTTNKSGEFQGTLRFGYFDENEFLSTIEKDISLIKHKEKIINLAMTHLNVTDSCVILADGMRTPYNKLKFGVRYASYGKTAEDMHIQEVNYGKNT